MPTLTEAALKMSAAGLDFLGRGPSGGPATIPAEDVAAYMRDRDTYWAGKIGASAEDYAAWKAIFGHSFGGGDEAEVQCEGSTKKGARCRRWVFVGAPPIVGFSNRRPYLCHLHRGQGV
jgi:hypothetical protein